MSTANMFLWDDAALLASMLVDIRERSVERKGCRVSGYAVSESGVTPYPVIKRKCRDGKSRKFYAHHVVMMDKYKRTGATAMWDTDLFQVSHECHNPKCVNAEHLELLSAEANRAKNIHCVGHVACTACGVRMRVCKHPTLCLTTVDSICSSCERPCTL